MWWVHQNPSHGTLNLCQYLPAPLTEDPEGPGSGHQHMQLDLLQIRGCKPVCAAGGLYVFSFHHSVFMKKWCRITSITISSLSVWWLYIVLISHENSDYSSFSSLRRYSVTWFGSLGSGVAGDKQLLASFLYIVFHPHLCLVFSIFLLFSCIIDIKQDYDNVICDWFPVFGLARLPACSQERPPLHPGSIHVLNVNLSLQYISNAVKSYVDMCVHTCIHVCRAFLYLFSCFVNMRPCLPRASCFPPPQTGAAGPLQGPSPFQPLYLFPSLLAPWASVDPPLWVSDTGGHRIWQGVLGSMWPSCSGAGGLESFLET